MGRSLVSTLNRPTWLYKLEGQFPARPRLSSQLSSACIHILHQLSSPNFSIPQPPLNNYCYLWPSNSNCKNAPQSKFESHLPKPENCFWDSKSEWSLGIYLKTAPSTCNKNHMCFCSTELNKDLWVHPWVWVWHKMHGVREWPCRPLTAIEHIHM